MANLIPYEVIEKNIFFLRENKVMFDRDLAKLYGVSTSNLNKAVNRNIERFPSDFMFQLSKKEFEILKFQFGTSSWGGTRKLPYVFTEQGVAMLSGVLKSKRAIQVNIAIMRTFVKLREMVNSNKELSKKLEALEKKFDTHDLKIKTIFEVIKDLMLPEKDNKPRIGFKVK
ncbi:MAG TPA: ORF6N domain-containing protein [Ignavibacteria bacterium]|nr:ORF6N domain-containing protein [Ignavibacteria bacterium]HMQ98522.1 ORF6N domain-containing protein [Ignavibacteria bacterium]